MSTSTPASASTSVSPPSSRIVWRKLAYSTSPIARSSASAASSMSAVTSMRGRGRGAELVVVDLSRPPRMAGRIASRAAASAASWARRSRRHAS
jgi:hypothetical protein